MTEYRREELPPEIAAVHKPGENGDDVVIVNLDAVDQRETLRVLRRRGRLHGLILLALPGAAWLREHWKGVAATAPVLAAATAVVISGIPEEERRPPVARPPGPTPTVIETASPTPTATPTRTSPRPITISNNAPPTPVPPINPDEEPPPATPQQPPEPEPPRTPDPEPSPSPEPPDPSEEPEPPDPEPVTPQCDGIGLDVEVPPLLDIDACLL